MKKKVIFILIGALISIVGLIWLFPVKKNIEDNSELVRLSLRDVGNQLLLSNQDSTSLVLPIVEVENNKYQLSFQESLSINPDSLLNAIETSFDKTNLNSNYLVEVVKCEKKEVAYSYQIMDLSSQDIIPCKGRELPKSCYDVTVKFKKINTSDLSINWLAILLIGLGVFISRKGFLIKNNTKKLISKVVSGEVERIGIFLFYPNQNKLIRESEEIILSTKECEILMVFMENPNQIIKREELSKKVWEDKGVVVGRSLDTYISKLRKKLKADASIKLTNVHGVGYKLEINQ